VLINTTFVYYHNESKTISCFDNISKVKDKNKFTLNIYYLEQK